MPDMMDRPSCFFCNASASSLTLGYSNNASILSASTLTLLTVTNTLVPRWRTPISPPTKLSYVKPRIRLAALRKCLAWSNAWNPTTSACKIPSNNASPCSNSRNTWDVGNGTWVKKIIRTGLPRPPTISFPGKCSGWDVPVPPPDNFFPSAPWGWTTSVSFLISRNIRGNNAKW